MAFVTWNRFLDITEAIDEGSTYLNENTDFQHTDVPFDVKLPSENMPVNINIYIYYRKYYIYIYNKLKNIINMN